jgi:hypothetical protein
MYRGLIDNLAFVYGFICKGRGKMSQADMEAVTKGAHTVTKCAPAVLGINDATEDDEKDLQLALKMDRQIEEAYVFIMSLENF